AAALDGNVPDDLRGPLVGISDQVMSIPSYAYTGAVCEVEIDPETGLVEIIGYVSIDDCGRAVNPMLIHGQSHGGIAQGIGQTLSEQCVYDPGSGQLLSASLMDYAIPRADDPAFDSRPIADHRGGRCWSGAAQLSRPRTTCRSPRVPTLLDGRAPQLARHSERGNRGGARARCRRNRQHSGRCWRHYAAKPCPALDRRAVRHPRRASPRAR